MEFENPHKDNQPAASSPDENVYNELKGYFPEQYDLTPQELEESIRQRRSDFKAKRTKKSVMRSQPVSVPKPVAPVSPAEPVKPAESAKSAEPMEEDLTKYAPAEPDITIWDDIPSNEEEHKSPLLRFFSDAFDILEVFVLCTACLLLVFVFFARLTRVDGFSMNDTLQNGEFLIVSDLFYTPKQGDIVVVQNTSLEVEKLREPLVKRIIAVGGQTVNVAPDGTVTVTNKDGTSEVLEEKYIKQEPYDKNALECYVPEGYVFIMGDNRNNSTDSRDMRVGLMDERCICGRAILRVFPFTSLSVFKNPMAE